MQKATLETVALADEVLALVNDVTSGGWALSYRKHYIGVARGGLADNFVQFRPRKEAVVTSFRIPRSDETTALIEDAGVDTLPFDKQWGRYRLRLIAAEIDKEDGLGHLGVSDFLPDHPHRMIEARSGKMPTTSVRRRISRMRRSLGLFDQICRHTSLGKAVKARMSARAWSRWSAEGHTLNLGRRWLPPLDLHEPVRLLAKEPSWVATCRLIRGPPPRASRRSP